ARTAYGSGDGALALAFDNLVCGNPGGRPQSRYFCPGTRRFDWYPSPSDCSSDCETNPRCPRFRARDRAACRAESSLPGTSMPLVRGIPITDFCDDNRLTLRERLELFVTVRIFRSMPVSVSMAMNGWLAVCGKKTSASSSAA